MYKESIYNKVFCENGKVFLFNALKNRIVNINSQEEYFEMLEKMKKGVETSLFKYLYNLGFLIEEDVDEEKEGELSFSDQIFSNDLYLTLMVSEECNFRCKYCYEKFERGNMEPEVIEGLIKYLRKNVSSYHRIYIDWFGGEPLLGINEIEHFSKAVIPMCRKLGKQYVASMTTNGYLLTSDNVKKLLENKVYNIQITIDGVEGYHDQYRVLKNGTGTFQVILNNLRNIRDNIADPKLHIDIRTNITSENMNGFEDFLRLVAGEFGDDKRFSFYFRPVGDWGGERAKKLQKTFIDSMDDAFDLLLKHECILNVDAYFQMLRMRVCNAAYRNSYVIGANGTVYKCTMLLGNECNHIGIIDESGNMNLEYSKLAKWALPESNLPEKCNECNQKSICRNMYCAASSQFGKKENCGYETDSIRYIIKLLDRAKSKHIYYYDKEVL